MGLYTPEKCRSSIIVSVFSLVHHYCAFSIVLKRRKFPSKFLYALVESRRKSVLAHAAQFCRAVARK